MEPFSRDSDLKEDIIPKEKNKSFIPIKQLIAIIIILAINVILAIILMTYLLNTSSSKNTKSHYSEIKCIYNIDNSSFEIPILGEDFPNMNTSILSIYVNESKIKVDKLYKFDTEGVYLIKYIFNDEMNMDYMFKDIETLQEVDMYSNTSDKIVSMISSFENCINLKKVSINGFNMGQLKSTSKLFYNTGIQNLKINNFRTNNIEDMSYMFANTNILELNLTNFYTGKVKNMSGLFKNNANLQLLDISSFNTENVIDMSEMFYHCESLTSLDISNFKTNKVESMRV